MMDLNRQFITLRWVLTCVLSVVILGQSLMTVADAHRLYQPLDRHVEAGHEHPFELSAPSFLADRHQHGGDAASASDKESDNEHCCHCHGSLHLFVVTDLNMATDAPHPASTEYGFPVSDPALPRLARPPIA